jgi:hypothetical protein
MSSKNSLPWDIEQAMTAFHVDPNWYDEYWLRDANESTGPRVRRRRHIRHAVFALLAVASRFFRLLKAMHQRPASRFSGLWISTSDECPPIADIANTCSSIDLEQHLWLPGRSNLR